MKSSSSSFRRQVQEDIRTRRILLPLDSDQSFGFGRSRDDAVNRINQLLYCNLQDRGFRSSALDSLTRRNLDETTARNLPSMSKKTHFTATHHTKNKVFEDKDLKKALPLPRDLEYPCSLSLKTAKRDRAVQTWSLVTGMSLEGARSVGSFPVTVGFKIHITTSILSIFCHWSICLRFMR